MSPERFEAVHAGMTAAARKVYAAVPIDESWHITKIVAELNRLGTRMEYSVVNACLSALQQAGLTRELSGREFRRERVRAAAPAKPKPTEKPMKNTATVTAPVAPIPAKISPLDRLGALAERANNMMEMLKALAADITDAALEIQADHENSKKGLELLSQFQNLVKSAGAA
jgi:hypothetical protein